MSSENLLGSLQAAAVTRLQESVFFTPGSPLIAIPVLAESDGSILADIDIALAKLGMCVIVDVASWSTGNSEAGGPHAEAVQVVCSVNEMPTLNRSATGTGVPALGVAEAVARLLHLWRPADVGISYPLLCTGMTSDADPRQGLFTRIVSFRGRASFNSKQPPTRQT